LVSDPRYPIGLFEAQPAYSSDEQLKLIAVTRAVPDALRVAVQGLSSEQLATPYRDGGWAVQAVVHHLPDAHANVLVRVQQALMSDSPVINVFFEDRWEHVQAKQRVPLELSLTLFQALQQRLVVIFESLGESDWKRTFTHPELGPQSLENTLARYAWHAQHHVAQITSLRQRMGW
jgi:DinB superfamily